MARARGRDFESALSLFFFLFFLGFFSKSQKGASDRKSLPGGPALRVRANVGGRIGNRVSPAESAFLASIGSGSDSVPGRGLLSEPMRCILLVTELIYSTRL